MKRLPSPAVAARALVCLVVPIALTFAIAQVRQPFHLDALLNTSGVSIAAGRALFEQNCRVCHSISRHGVEGTAPSLAAIGHDGASRVPGLGAPEYILESILDPSKFRAPGARGVMPQDIAASLPPEPIRDLVAFLASQGARPDLPSIARLEISATRPGTRPRRTVVRSQVERGLEVFQTKAACGNCHTLHPERKYFQLLAPPLFLASSFEDAYLFESIREPSRVVVPGYELVHVATIDGRLFSGRLLRDDPTSLLLLTLDAQGNAEPVAIPRNQIDTDDSGQPALTRTQVSPMPQGFAETLSPEEIDAVVAVLKSLH